MNRIDTIQKLKNIFFGAKFSHHYLVDCNKSIAKQYADIKSKADDALNANEIAKLHCDITAFDVIYDSLRKIRVAKNGSNILPLREVIEFRAKSAELKKLLACLETCLHN